MRLVWLLLLSLGLGLGGLYLATREELFSAALYAPTELTPALAALALACLLALWLAPVAKLVLLARSQGQRLGWWHAFVAHVAQVFGTAMTPAGTGGAPFLVVALGEVGVPSGVGLALAVQLFVLDLAALGVLILLGLGYLLLASPVVLGPLLAVTAGVAGAAALAVSVLLARFPAPAVRWLHALTRWRILRRFRPHLRRMAVDYRASATAFRDLPLVDWAWLHLVNLTAWLSNFALFWVLLTMYGADTPLLQVLALLAMITLLSFFVPTPGASGVMELLLGLAAFDTGSRLRSVAAPVVLWRLTTFYAAFVLGPLCASLLLTRRRDRPGRPAREAVAAAAGPGTGNGTGRRHRAGTDPDDVTADDGEDGGA